MPASFLDTSALAKHYHHEIGSSEVDLQRADSARDLFVSRIGVVEAISVFAGKVRTRELSSSAFAIRFSIPRIRKFSEPMLAHRASSRADVVYLLTLLGKESPITSWA
jgi:hypothetical protein